MNASMCPLSSRQFIIGLTFALLGWISTIKGIKLVRIWLWNEPDIVYLDLDLTVVAVPHQTPSRIVPTVTAFFEGAKNMATYCFKIV